MKVAFCLKGAVGKSFDFRTNSVYTDSPYVDYKKCRNSIYKYIVNQTKYNIDFFCHCWNKDLEESLKELYNPKMIVCENNNDYYNEISSRCHNEYAQVSHALSMKKVIELKEQYEKENNFNYDIVILYRYDVLLWKNMVLDKYNINDDIYVNAHVNSDGDFHFIMNNDTSKYFKNLYESALCGNIPIVHYWIKHYVTNYLKKNLLMDDIYPGIHQEVIRKIYVCSINTNHLSIELYNVI